MKPTIQISMTRFKQLRRAEKILFALTAAGVDNWEGYEPTMNMLAAAEKMKDEDV